MKNISCGIDIGSRTTKAVLFNNDLKEIIDYEVTDTTSSPKESARRIFYNLLRKHSLNKEELISIISTGYGRDQFEEAHSRVTEITCHARGVTFLYPDVEGIIDIGGQDSKAIRIENGMVADFSMNDKCAAGTGRFLEMVTEILDISEDNMESLLLESRSPCTISSMCVVFAESEIISLLASGHKSSDILAGVLEALAKRTHSMANKIGFNGKIVFTGGVAKNKAMVRVMEKVLGKPVIIPYNPSITGALGAALKSKIQR